MAYRAPSGVAALMLAVFAWSLAARDAPARTPVAVEGVEDDALRRQMVALLPDRDRPDSLFAAERLSNEAAGVLEAFLRSEGWYGGAAEPAASGDPPTAAVRVRFGERFRLRAPDLTFASPLAEEAAAAAQAAAGGLVAGEPARAAVVLATEAAIVEAIAAAGYPDVEALPRRVVVDHAANAMSVTYAIAPGARARLGELVVSPDTAVLDRVQSRIADWPEGETYDPAILDRTRRAFTGPAAFERVRVALAPDADDDGVRDVLVTIDPGRPRTLAVGAAYSTLEGVGVDGQWSRRNLLEQLETFTATARVAENEKRLGAALRFPHALGRGRSRSYTADIASENLQPFERRGVRVATAVDDSLRRGIALSYGLSLAADFFDASAGAQDAYTVSAFGELRTNTADSPLDPRRGRILIGRLEPGVATGDATVFFTRATLEGRAYRSFGDEERWTLATRARAGWVAALTGSEEELPLDRRFYAGGGGSVRGYEFNSIFPLRRRAFNEPPGGQGLLEGAVEARGRFAGRWGGVAFLDAGSAFDDVADATDLRYGAGLGVRYDLGFAPLRLDVAVPLQRREQDAPFAVYLSLGQAF